MKRVRQNCLDAKMTKTIGISGCNFFTGEDLSILISK